MLKFKTYQLFIFLAGPFILAMSYPFIAIAITGRFELPTMVSIVYIWLIILYSWFLENLVRMNKLLDENLKLSGKISIVFGIIGLIGISIILPPVMLRFLAGIFERLQIIGIILLLLSSFGNFFIARTIAKNMRTLELSREAIVKEYLGEFLLIWFFPIGIWVIHPRIKKILGLERDIA
ncbi:hypothetical protein [Leptospira noguchii]|uniref:Uncharacterized protein n=1 Tax=Leptospira noguchii serovar Panama str. CZ214 TaxID=1001595 RepID=T0FHT3_9LEPT|nr:hypothetical protein [Leptospira noguchii]EQA72903.1 hypothetical protein LEP1GSC059_3324 [Leptospira noguchii serovar Panama str. CZ214]